jgi:methionyl-tRNA synthetase
MDPITYDDFKKLEFKIATVKEVALHPQADRLFVVKLDLGGEIRQVVAGIRASYPVPEALIGRQVVCVANLTPAVIRGVESQGMILAASDEAGTSVVSPDRVLKEGSIVK